MSRAHSQIGSESKGNKSQNISNSILPKINGISAFCRENPQYTSSGIGLILNNKTKKYKDIIAVEKIYE